MGTYSSIALRILRKEIHLLGRNSNFTVIDNEDQESAIKEICKLHNIDHKKITPKRLLSAISTFKNMQYEEVDSLSIDKFKKIDLYT
jgi:DNA helicase-2/ATP-dependent DNA helicase PcrA